MNPKSGAKYLTLMCGATVASLAMASEATERPNVLFIMCDNKDYKK